MKTYVQSRNLHSRLLASDSPAQSNLDCISAWLNKARSGPAMPNSEAIPDYQPSLTSNQTQQAMQLGKIS